jgi:hypothetical protein
MDTRPRGGVLRKLLVRRRRIGPYWTITAPSPLLVTVGTVLLGVGALWLRREATIAGHGHLVGWSPDNVVNQVRLLGHDFFIDTALDRVDVVTAVALGILAGVTLIAAVLLRGWTRAPRRTSRAFAIATAAALFAALDEGLALHETAGLNLEFLRALPLVDHPDDVLMAIYGLGVIAFAWTIRDLVRPYRSAKLWMVAGVALFVLAQLIDLLPTESLVLEEEMLELFAAACFAVGFLGLAVHHIDHALTDNSALITAFQREEQPDSGTSTAVGRSSVPAWNEDHPGPQSAGDSGPGWRRPASRWMRPAKSTDHQARAGDGRISSGARAEGTMRPTQPDH